MSRITAPLLSFGASGQIAQTQVYSSWKGRAYVRRYVVPGNPNTAEQQLTRNTFRWLNNVWKYYPGAAVSAWDAYGDSLRITNRNAFLKANNGPLREETDLTFMVLSPSARGGLAAASMTPTPGSGSVELALVPPSLPSGWTIVKAVAAAIRDQDPQTETFFTVSSAEDATDPYAPTITGLTASEPYLVGAWFEYMRPDGTPAYGQASQAMSTPTA